MRTSLLSLLAVTVAAAPGCHESPAEITPTRPTENVGASSNDSSKLMRAMDPVARLLDQRQELELSGNQVAQLEAIQRRLAEQNNPLVTQLQDLRPDGARGRWLGLRGRQGSRHARMRDLTPEEREEMRERFQARREEMQNLTPEEREQLREQRKARRQEIAEHAAEIRELPAELRAGEEGAGGDLDPGIAEQRRQRLEELRNEMRERHPEWVRDSEEAVARREEMRKQMEELRPVLEQLRDNNQHALQEARAVLTEEQRTRLESRREEMRREMRERRGERRGPRYRMRLESDERDAQSEGESR